MAILSRGTKGSTITMRFESTGGHLITEANVAGESISGLTLRTVSWSAPTSHKWTVTRGSNTVLSLTHAGEINFDSRSLPLEKGGESSANVVATLSGGTDGTMILKFKKKSNFTSEY
jgi:hypothetical protein